MAERLMKYNPAFLSEEQLITSFAVRQADMELITRAVRENTGGANQHVLVVGPRGIGKTMLVLRVAAEVRRDKDLNQRWYPLAFGEESYTVGSPGEFWLHALFHLGEQTGDERWKRAFAELRQEPDEARLRERALAQVVDFADAAGKRILLIVENLHMLMGEQLTSDDAWVLRHTLLNEPRIMLLGTATTRFEQVASPGSALFELFKLQGLQPLDQDECGQLWRSLTGQEPAWGRIRAIQILTGGSPRLLAMICSFASGLSLRELLNDLMQLVDDHTEYFKSHLDALPGVERKVYAALAEIWDPATARQVAAAARLDVSKTSALLNRLVGRGAVVVDTEKPRRRFYRLAERLYNIYYLMRLRGAPSDRVRALVRFMVSFYNRPELLDIVRRVAEEANQITAGARDDHLRVLEAILDQCGTAGIQAALAAVVPDGLIRAPDVPTHLKETHEEARRKVQEARKLAHQAVLQLGRTGKTDAAETLLRKAIRLTPDDIGLRFLHGLVLLLAGRRDQCQQEFRNALGMEPKNPAEWVFRGIICLLIDGQYEEAESAFRAAMELTPDETALWSVICIALVRQGRFAEALEAAAKFVADPRNLDTDEKAPVQADPFACLCAAGFGREAIAVIESSPSAQALEPVRVAIHMYSGERPQVAPEVLEVAKDVVGRIEKWKAILSSEAKGTDP